MLRHDPTHCIVFNITAIALPSYSRFPLFEVTTLHVQCHQVLCTAKVVGNGAAKAIVIENPDVVARRRGHCGHGVLY